MAVTREVTGVYMDIAAFIWATGEAIDNEGLEQWCRDLRASLALRDPTRSAFGAKLLGSAHAYKEEARQSKAALRDKIKQTNAQRPQEAQNASTRNDEDHGSKEAKATDVYGQADENERERFGRPQDNATGQRGSELPAMGESGNGAHTRANHAPTRLDCRAHAPGGEHGAVLVKPPMPDGSDKAWPKAKPKRGLEMPQDPDFLAWWEAYPNRTGKVNAFLSWEKTYKARPPLAEMLATLEWQKRTQAWTKDGGQFIPMPSTYLNQARWADAQPPRAKTLEEEQQETYNRINAFYSAGDITQQNELITDIAQTRV